MLRTALVLAVFSFASCRCTKPTPAPKRLALGEGCMCPCPCPDAPPIDAPAVDADPTTPWIKHILVTPTATGALRGADSNDVALVDGVPSVCSSWEQGGAATIAKLDGTTTSPIVGTSLSGGEDTRCVDVDADQHTDLISLREAQEITVLWGTAFGTDRTTIAAASNVQRWMQGQWGSVLNDGSNYLLAGGRNANGTTTASIGYFTTTDARSASSWTYHQRALVGWTMGLKLYDVDVDGKYDVFFSDRGGAGNVGTLKGLWYLKFVVGTIPSWTPVHMAHISGDVSFADVADADGDGDTDAAGGNRTTLTLYTQTAPDTWTPSSNLITSDVGDLHGVLFCDIDGVPPIDIVTTYALSDPGESWIVWQDTNGTRHEVSGPAVNVEKPDQPACYDVDTDGDLDVVFSAGGNDSTWTDDTGVGWFENPRINSGP